MIPLDAMLRRLNFRKSSEIPKFVVRVENSVVGVSGLSSTSVGGLLSVEFIELTSQLVGIGCWGGIGHLEFSLVRCRLRMLIKEN